MITWPLGPVGAVELPADLSWNWFGTRIVAGWVNELVQRDHLPENEQQSHCCCRGFITCTASAAAGQPGSDQQPSNGSPISSPIPSPYSKVIAVRENSFETVIPNLPLLFIAACRSIFSRTSSPFPVFALFSGRLWHFIHVNLVITISFSAYEIIIVSHALS